MFSSITIASSTTKPIENQRHHREVVQAEVQHLHHGERAENGKRQGERG
jgi:hypothetical protein